MSTASASSFKNRLKVDSEERVPKKVFTDVQGEVCDLVQDIFSQAGSKESLPRRFTASAWDGVKCPSKSKFESIKKSDLAELLERCCRLLVERCYPSLDHMCSELEESEQNLLRRQEELLTVHRSLKESQERLVKLQCELLEKREAEISAVQSTAQTEIKSFADVLQKKCDSALAPKRVQRAIENATEERCNNIIIHGIPDCEGEEQADLEYYVNKVVGRASGSIVGVLGFGRIGRYREDSDRPVKLRLSGKAIRDELLSNKAQLRTWEVTKDMYISPDLSIEEREVRRRLVVELKKRKEAEPGKKFIIRGGKVVEKPEGPGNN